MLAELAGSRTAPVREVERAKVLLRYADGLSITDVMRRVGVRRPMIYKCIDKALAAGVAAGLKDAYHRPHEPEITDEAKAWVVSIACTKPKEPGLAAELWSISALAAFVSERANTAGRSSTSASRNMYVVYRNELVTIPRQSRGLSGLRPAQRGLLAIQSQGKLSHHDRHE